MGNFNHFGESVGLWRILGAIRATGTDSIPKERHLRYPMANDRTLPAAKYRRINFPMSINIDSTGVQPASDEAIRTRLLQELNRAYAEAPRMADYSVQVELCTYDKDGDGKQTGLRWNFSAHGPNACIVSMSAITPQIGALQLGHKFRQQLINASNT
jgi:hypothetical protein